MVREPKSTVLLSLGDVACVGTLKDTLAGCFAFSSSSGSSSSSSGLGERFLCSTDEDLVKFRCEGRFLRASASVGEPVMASFFAARRLVSEAERISLPGC